MHPSEVLFQGAAPPAMLPSCDHYAGSESLMRKSLALQRGSGAPFDVTLDCEDGAAAGNEAEHARMAGALAAASGFGRQPGGRRVGGRVGIRVHDPASPFFEQDISLVCQTGAQALAYLVVPKILSLADALRATETVDHHARLAGRADLPLHFLIETPSALADVHAIAALPQVESLSFGIMDFISAHHGAIPATAMRSPGQFQHPLVVRAKLEVAAACHAHGKVPSHNVTTDIRDPEVVAADARRAATEFGYTRMWSIHPDQIQPIVQAFSPQSSEIDEAAAILLAAQRADWGPVRHHGRLHDRGSYPYYWMVLRRAHQNGMELPDAAAALL